MTTHDDQTGTVAEIMREADIAVLTYVSLDGALVSTPMGTQDFEDPGTTWFITERSSDKVRAIEADPRVNVAYSSKAGWVSLSGTAHVSDDRAKLDELWDASAGAFMRNSRRNRFGCCVSTQPSRAGAPGSVASQKPKEL